MHENNILRESVKLSYDDSGAAVIDERIERELKKFSVRERASVLIFLEGASKPMSLDKIEAIAKV